VFVEFFAPWCGHCKSLAPEYEVVATTFKGHAVRIASVDADKHKELATRFEVSGYPTLKFFPAGESKAPEAYSGGRTAPDIVDFINKKTGLTVRMKSAPSAVVALDEASFDKIVKDPTKDVLVEFYAPWCGHCKQLAPKYDEVGKTFDGEDSVVIAKLDADAHRQAAQPYYVKGYPTIKFFPKNNKAGEAYSGAREASDFVNFINERSGTERTLGGGYTDRAGRIPELDELAGQYPSADVATRRTLRARAEKLLEADSVVEHKHNAYAKIYVNMMQRIDEKGVDFAHSEVARLRKMISGGSVTAKKVADFSKRANIAAQFVASK